MSLNPRTNLSGRGNESSIMAVFNLHSAYFSFSIGCIICLNLYDCQAVSAHAFNSSTQEAETGRTLWFWHQSGLQSKFQDSLQSYRETLSWKTNKQTNIYIVIMFLYFVCKNLQFPSFKFLKELSSLTLFIYWQTFLNTADRMLGSSEYNSLSFRTLGIEDFAVFVSVVAPSG